jgi:hypothetical protein
MFHAVQIQQNFCAAAQISVVPAAVVPGTV